MAWKAVHPDLTEDVRIPDEEGAPTFTLGFWPPREAVRLSVLAKAWIQRQQRTQALDPEKDQEELLRCSEEDRKLFTEASRWSVRGWSGLEIPCATTQETIEGRQHAALAPAALAVLFHSHVIRDVGLAAINYNVLSGETRGKSERRSGSSSTSPDTSAAGAAPATIPHSTESPTDSRTAPSTAGAPAS